MRKLWMTTAISMALAGPAAAQSLDDAGRLLQRVLPGQQQPNQGQSERDRQIYEQGRRDQEEAGRREGNADDRSPAERRADDRRRAEERQRVGRDQDRRRSDQQRTYDEDNQPRQQLNRNQPFDNR